MKRVEFNGCHSSFRVSSENPQVEFDFWKDGVVLGHFAVVSAKDAAQVFHQLFVLEQSILELEPQLSKFQLDEHAPAFLEGPKSYTDRQWQFLLSQNEHPPFDELHPVLAAARAHPQLGVLYPFTTMWTLYFSLCTGYPFDLRCSGIYLTQDEGVYEVHPRTHRKVIEFRGSLEDALNFIAAQLPPGCGPARQGTGEDA